MPAKDNKKTNNFDKKSCFEKGWDVEKTLDNDPRFGQCFLLQHVEKNTVVEEKRLLMKEYLTSSEADARNMVKTLEERQHLDHPHIQRLHDWASAKKSDFCSTYYKFKSYYTWPVRSLADDYTKLAMHEGLNHETLTHVMYQMLQALDFLHSHDKFFNDVRPEYIGHLESANSFILCDRLNYPGDAAEVQRQVALNPNKRIYMSPQMWRLVNADKKAAQTVEYDRSKGDTWALGMVLLMGGLNKSAKEQNAMYVRRTKQSGADINHEMLENWLHEFSDKYDGVQNHILGEIVRHCLEEDEHRRPTAHDILSSHLPDYARVCEHFGDQDVHSHKVHHEPRHEVVVQHEPRHEVVYHEPRHEVVYHEPRHEVVHHEPRHEVVHHEPHHESRVVKGETVRREPVVIRESHHGEPIRHVTKREPEIRREYIDIHGNKSSVAPVHDSHHNVSTSHVHQEHRPVNTTSHIVHHDEPTVVRQEPTVVRQEPTVVRREPTVVRQEPTVVRQERRVSDHAPVHHEERRVEHHEPRVVRREPTVVRQEPTVVRHESKPVHHEERRVESTVHHPAPTVIRRSHHGDSHHQSNVVRTSGNVVRRSVAGDHHQPTTIRRSVIGDQHHHNAQPTTIRRSVAGDHHHESRVTSHHAGNVSNHHGSTVRRVTDPEEIRRIKEKNSGHGHRVEEVVEHHVSRRESEEVIQRVVEMNGDDCEVIVEHRD